MVKKEKFRDHAKKNAGKTTISRKPLVVPAFVFESRNLTETISLKNLLIFCRDSVQAIRDADGADPKTNDYFFQCINHLSIKVKEYTGILEWDDKRVFQEMIESGKKIVEMLKSIDSGKNKTVSTLSVHLYADIAGFEWRVVRLLEQLNLA
ncbi:MAG: hypothetical protein ACOC41_05450 [Chitinivibrionales bacterium]